MTSWTPNLPDIPSTGEIVVEDERHLYQSYLDENGFQMEDYEYTFDKAPIFEIIEVTGVHNGNGAVFTKGEDYTLSDDRERIVWKNTGLRPDPGSYFRITYRSKGIVARFVEAQEEEFEDTEQMFDNLIQSKFVDRAKDEELDMIGEVFGQLGERRGKNDNEYRVYLKSVVQSLVSRGTRDDIKTAIAATTGIKQSDIEISEDFENVAYDVVIPLNIDHKASTVAEIAELADPSGVKFGRIRYTPHKEAVAIDDGMSVSESFEIGPDTMVVDEILGLDDDHFGWEEGTAISDDGYERKPDATPNEAMATNDTVNVEIRSTGWDLGDWTTMYWTSEEVDTEKPTTPQNLRLVEVGANTAELDWDTSSDDQHVDYYIVRYNKK